MRRERIEEVHGLALRFVNLSTALLRDKEIQEKLFGSKQSGELRRLSMELTRALAEMRKP